MMPVMAKFRDRAAALRETGPRGGGDAGAPLRLVEIGTGGFVHELAGEVVGDGEILELLLETGWVAGHYRAQLHPESGRPAFEVHVAAPSGPAIEHIRIHLPHRAILRRVIDPARGVSPAALRTAGKAFGGDAQPGEGKVAFTTTAPDG